MNGGINDDLYTELYTRCRALLRREKSEEVRLKDLLVVGFDGGSLMAYYYDEHTGGSRGPRLLLRAGKDGEIEQRSIGDGRALDSALAVLREEMVLDDLSEV